MRCAKRGLRLQCGPARPARPYTQWTRAVHGKTVTSSSPTSNSPATNRGSNQQPTTQRPHRQTRDRLATGDRDRRPVDAQDRYTRTRCQAGNAGKLRHSPATCTPNHRRYPGLLGVQVAVGTRRPRPPVGRGQPAGQSRGPLVGRVVVIVGGHLSRRMMA